MSRNSEVINKLIKQINELIDKAITPTESKIITDNAASQIRKRTRLGYGVDGSGKQVKLRPLTEKYKEFRDDNKEELSSFTKPSRSNLTATGQMLDAIKGIATKGKLQIEISGQRKQNLDGSRSKISNSTLARYVQEQGRPFFALTKAEKTGVIRDVKKVLLRVLKAGLK